MFGHSASHSHEAFEQPFLGHHVCLGLLAFRDVVKDDQPTYEVTVSLVERRDAQVIIPQGLPALQADLGACLVHVSIILAQVEPVGQYLGNRPSQYPGGQVSDDVLRSGVDVHDAVL